MTYPVGAFFVTKISGTAGWWIGLGQALCGRPSRYSHAGIIVTADGAIVEAEPGGARLAHIDEYDPAGVLVCDGPVRQWNATHPGGDMLKRAQVAASARSLLGTPYSVADYLALACLHLRLPSAWIRQRVARSGRLICSQLVDLCYQRSGIRLFPDGRYPGDVMPSDLADWAETWQEAHR